MGRTACTEPQCLYKGALLYTVSSNRRNSNFHCSLFSKENPIIGNFCISGRLAVPINPDNWSSIVYLLIGAQRGCVRGEIVHSRHQQTLLLNGRYNSLRVLVRSTIVLHKFLSNTLLFQFLIFIFCKSILTSSSHLGLPFGLEASGFHL